MNKDLFEPCQNNEKDPTHDQTTMFLNKYCEDTDIPIVANRLAEGIVQYEVAQAIPFHYLDDDKIDDEIITEEEFLSNVDYEMDLHAANHEETVVQLEECLDEMSSTHREVNDEISDHMDMLLNPSEDQSQVLAENARNQAKSAV